MASEYQDRLKDEFFLAARVRPATEEHYVSWLEAYLDGGGKVSSLASGAFAQAKFFTMSASARIPDIDGDRAISIIVPPGVTPNVERVGDCRIYFIDGATKNGNASAQVWPEMLDMLIGDGYPMSRLVDEWELRRKMQEAIVDRVTRGQERSGEFYGAFGKLSFAAIDSGLKDISAMPAEILLRDILKMKADTPIDPATQAILDEQKREALKVLEVLHYKLNPEHQEPIPIFGKRAKHLFPEEPNAGLSGQIQVGPPLKYKGPGPQQ
ncbi:MAG: hypothetical protein EPN97_16840 [Alphaproteobacteria bacterium]|nr:MAG: hypothetical protein EPN97_16840 [Alphaproteobacteria bacterium]